MRLINLYEHFDKLYPFISQEEWDKSGWINKYENIEINQVLISLDINLDIINQAIKYKIKLIISHHPMFIDENDLKLNHIKKMINLIEENNITILSMHTNFDKAKYGMNYCLAKQLKLTNIKRSQKSPYMFIGELKKKVDFTNFIETLKKQTKLNHIIYDLSCYHLVNNKKVNRIAIVGGSGSSDLYSIRNKDKIDVFLTGEVKWHLYSLANVKKLSIVDIGHVAESIFIEEITKQINKIDNTIEVVKSYKHPNLVTK